MPAETALSFSEKHVDLLDINEDVAAYLRNCRAFQVCAQKFCTRVKLAFGPREAYLRGGEEEEWYCKGK